MTLLYSKQADPFPNLKQPNGPVLSSQFSPENPSKQ